MLSLQRFSIVLALALPFSLGTGCSSSSENLSTKGQMIECQVAADGTASNCTPTDSPSGAPGTCIDIDDDGDGDAHDEADDEDGVSSFTGRPADEDDDDGDGVPNGDDCDKLPGGDDDDGA